MTEPHPDPHGIQHPPAGTPAGPGGPFTGEELLEFRRSDLGSGRVIVALMAGIFTIGFFLYGAIAFIVSQ
jgi:hypothetical protein